MNIDTIVWWTGASVIGTIGLAGAAALVVGTATVATYFATIYALKFGNIVSNLSDMHAWVGAGRPKWEWDEDRCMHMRPTTAPN